MALPLRAVVLDFDGVILESNGLKTQAFERVFARVPEHAAAMVEHHHRNVSASRYDKFRHLVVERLGRSADDPLIADLANAFSEEMMRLIVDCPMVPGAAEFLSTVSTRVPIFLASMTPQSELEDILVRRDLASMFSGVYGCPPWPKADAIRQILGKVGGPEGVVFVGDSAGDQRAACETGTEFIARDSGLAFDVPPPALCHDMHAVLAAVARRLPAPQTTVVRPQ